jgi:DNA modification methylase
MPDSPKTNSNGKGNAAQMKQKHKSALLTMKAKGLWNGSFNGRESTLQQLSPHVGKLKSGTVSTLIEHFTKRGQWVCDPFSGSGVVPLQSLLMGRRAAANDLSIYAYCLTRGKLESPATYEEALKRVGKMITYVEKHSASYDLRRIDSWVRQFFHPQTLKETLAAFDYCRTKRDWFLASCLCGILHHQRPGFLSYPSSHMVPYLRLNLFPRDEYPEMYFYRSVADRVRKKVKRAYRRPQIKKVWSSADYEIRRSNAQTLGFGDESMNFILTSPPYYGALDYARDNRLRLWFLGERDWHKLDRRLTAREAIYEQQMEKCLKEIYRVLKRKRYCVLIVGEFNRNGKTRDTAAVLSALASRATQGRFVTDCIVQDEIKAFILDRLDSHCAEFSAAVVSRRPSNHSKQKTHLE